MTYTGFTTFPSIKQYHLFVKCFIRSGRETEGKKRGQGEKFGIKTAILGENLVFNGRSYLIIVTDATDAVSVNFSGRCKFLLI